MKLSLLSIKTSSNIPFFSFFSCKATLLYNVVLVQYAILVIFPSCKDESDSQILAINLKQGGPRFSIFYPFSIRYHIDTYFQ